MTLVQHKQDVVKAIKAQQYEEAAAVLETALALAPGDALLLEFQGAVQAKLKLDDEASSSDDDESGCSQGSGSAESYCTDEQEVEDESESINAESSCSASDAGDEEDSCNASPSTDTEAVTAGATLNGKSIQGCDAEQLPPLQEPHQQGGRCAEMSSISLAASSSMLTPQQRLQLRQQLAASISQQKDELVRQQLLDNDPLLAAL